MKKGILIAIFILMVFTTLVSINYYSYVRKYEEYFQLELNLVTEGKKYIEKNDTNKKINILRLGQLQENNILKIFKVEDDVCDGYVQVSKETDKTIYRPFITCENYESYGYDDTLKTKLEYK